MMFKIIKKTPVLVVLCPLICEHHSKTGIGLTNTDILFISDALYKICQTS